MFNHYRGTGGYAALYLVLVFGVMLLTLIVSTVLSMIGFGQSAGMMAGGVIFIAFWVVGFIVMQRFVAIENRRPTLAESNIVGVKSVLYFLGVVLSLALIVATIIFLVKLIGGGGAEAGQAGQGAQAAQNEPNAEQKQQAIGALWGVFATLFLLYVAPFLNLAVLSRLVAPSSKTA